MNKILLLLTVLVVFTMAGCFTENRVKQNQTVIKRIRVLVSSEKRFAATVVKNGIYITGTTTLMYTFSDFLELLQDEQDKIYTNAKAYIVYKDKYIDMFSFSNDINVTAGSFLSGTNGVKAVLDETIIPMNVITKSGENTISRNIPSTLVTYQALPNNKYQSDRYKVEVSQNGGSTYESYVYMDTAPSDLSPTTDYAAYYWYSKANHFTSFSFDGRVTVKVTLPNRAIPLTSAFIRPLSKGITPTINGNTITFSLNSPTNLFLDVTGETRQPLFIFANPPESNVPSQTAPNVFYFGPGFYDIGTSGSIYQNLPSGSIVYLAGGAFVRGSFQRDNNTYNSATYGGDLTIRGRGILSQTGLPRYPSATAVPLVYAKYSKVNIEGIVMTDITNYSVESYYGKLNNSSIVDNVKIFGWYSHADGPHIGAYGVVKNCFFKLSDDNLFAFFSNQQSLDNVVWQQQGAVIQLSWNLTSNASNMLIRGLDVIGCDMSSWHPGYTYYDSSLISMHNLEGANYSGLTIQDVTVESKMLQLFAVKTKQDWDNKPLLAGTGSVDGIIFKNINVMQVPNYPGIFDGNGINTGDIKNITFDNVTIGGTRITGANASTYFTVQGNTSGFNFY